MSEDINAVLEKARRGDNDALDAIFEQYKGLVRAKTRSYFLIGADGEDLIQEGMIGLYKAIRDYKPERHASFKAFADLCVKRQIITAVYAATRQKHMPLNSYVSLSKLAGDDQTDNFDEYVLQDNAVSNPEQLFINRETSKSFNEDLKKLLSDLELSVLSLYLDGSPYSAISKKIGKPEKSIDNALQRVKRKLEKYLV